MSQSTLTFSVESRKTGKSASGQYRHGRKIPAVIYGPKMENINCVMDEIFVVKHSGSKHESSIFQTTSDDKGLSGLKVMMKKIEKHPGSNRPIHVDLYALDMSAKIKVNVSLQLEGEPAGVKEQGGVLQVVLREVEIECNPIDIPESIKVDISGLHLNESLHISDITFADGIVPISAPERTICNVSMPKEEAEPEVAVAAEGAEGAAEGAAAPAPDAEAKKD